mmetsp:Transcript_65817/g.195876  ORF Transcript_65817/g.195876 Transcript_65817/m.195876 type:complete len:338 (+) Transcript_65817:89-1102(+)
MAWQGLPSALSLRNLTRCSRPPSYGGASVCRGAPPRRLGALAAAAVVCSAAARASSNSGCRPLASLSSRAPKARASRARLSARSTNWAARGTGAPRARASAIVLAMCARSSGSSSSASAGASRHCPGATTPPLAASARWRCTTKRRTSRSISRISLPNCTSTGAGMLRAGGCWALARLAAKASNASGSCLSSSAPNVAGLLPHAMGMGEPADPSAVVVGTAGTCAARGADGSCTARRATRNTSPSLMLLAVSEAPSSFRMRPRWTRWMWSAGKPQIEAACARRARTDSLGLMLTVESTPPGPRTMTRMAPAAAACGGGAPAVLGGACAGVLEGASPE